MYVGIGQLTALNKLQTTENIRRRNAEQAYEKNGQYNESKHERIAKLLIENILEDDVVKKESAQQSLGAGQMKQVHLPIGKSLEETIQLWQGVRNEALSDPEPTTADYQLASKASMNITKAEAQLGLNRQAEAEVNEAVYEERVAAFMRLAEGFSTPLEETLFEQGERYKRAVTAYSFQVQQKLSGFQVNTSSFLKIA